MLRGFIGCIYSQFLFNKKDAQHHVYYTSYFLLTSFCLSYCLEQVGEEAEEVTNLILSEGVLAGGVLAGEIKTGETSTNHEAMVFVVVYN